MSRRQLWVAVIFAVVWSLAPARSAHAQKMYKWTDRDGKVHYSNVAPQGDTPDETPSSHGVETQGGADAAAAAVTGDAARTNNEAPNEVPGLPPDGRSSVSDEVFSSQVSATRSRFRRELAQAKDESREAAEALAEAKRLNDASKEPGLEMLQRALDPKKQESSDEDTIKAKKAKADAKIADIRAQYEKLKAEATTRNGGAAPSWWLPIE